MNAPSHPRDLLSGYLDDELTSEERSGVDRHLALCEPCRKQIDSLKALARAVADEPVPPVPAGLAERIGRRIDDASVARVPARRRDRIPASIAATIGAVGLLAVLQWQERAARAPVSGLPPAELQRSTASPDAPAPAIVEPERANELAKEKKSAVVPAKPADLRDEGEGAAEFAPVPAAPPPEPVPVEASAAKAEEAQPLAGAARRDRLSAKDDAEETRQRSAARAQSLGYVGAAPAVCAERWVDTGLLGSWAVADADRAGRELDALAREVGGRIESVEPYADQLALVVPRGRVPEVIAALKRKGVTGLDTPVTPEEGFACVRQRVSLRTGG